MVARNFSLQDLPYSLHQVPDDEREFMRLDELKPHQLTELGVVTQQQHQQQQQQKHHQHHASQQITNNESGVVVVHQHQQQQQQQQQHQSQKSQTLQHVSNGNLQSQTFHQHGYYEIASGQQSPPMPNSCNQNNYMNNNNNNDIIVQQQTHMCLSGHMSSDGNGTEDTNDQKYHRHGGSNSTRKRKLSLTDPSDVEDGDDAKSVRTVDDNKKQNHSEIEKRRRDKMNQFIGELSSMIPMCHAMSRKLDKLTVLRMAVQHIRTIRGAVHSYTENYKPAFLSDQELKMLILQAAEGFLFVVGCDRGRILYVSESVSQILNYSPSDLLGQSWFDILHPKDVAKVKEQLSSSDSSPRERLIDAKTMLPVKATDVPQGVSKLCLGARRSFFCRMKYKATAQIKEETDMSTCHRRKKQQNQDKKYSVIQCTGYLKSWAPAKIGVEEQEIDGDGELGTLSCLVAVGRVQPNIFSTNALKTGGTGDNNNSSQTTNNNGSQNTSNGDRNTNHRNLRNIQFISRHAMDGKFLFVDQRATLVLGFLPQELLGTSMYEYYHHLDLPALAESHKAVLQTSERVTTPIYRQRSKHNGFIRMQSELKSFRNPWTKELEYLIAKNNVILSEFGSIDGNVEFTGGQGATPNSTSGAGYRSDGNSVSNYEFFNQSNGREIHRMINNHVEAAKIGRQIAEQVLDYQRRVGDSSSESSPDLDRHSTSNHNQNLDTTNSGSSTEHRSPLLFQTATGPGRINGTLPSYSRSDSHLLPDHVPDSEIISIITNQASQRQLNGLTQPVEGVSNPELTGDAAGDGGGGDGNGGGSQSDQGNDEAAMAVIMSLLEADAGLGGPVDFSGLPWPLP